MGLFDIISRIFNTNQQPAANAPVEDEKPSSKEKGDSFENYVISKFSRKFFGLKDMRSDKGIKGFYPESNQYPDLLFEYKPSSVQFAVECKWRAEWWKRDDGEKSIDWAGGDKKIQNYNEYAEKNNVPVFVAIGVGGTPDKPDKVFIAPLNALKYRYAKRSYLEKFIKKNFDFFFDPRRLILR